MIIGIDARSLIGKRAGVGRYLHNLLENLSGIDEENQYILYLHEEAGWVAGRPNFSEKKINLPFLENYFTWLHLRLPPELLTHRVDVFHFPFYTMPLVVNHRSVVTIHDITFGLHPEWFSLKGKIAQIPFCRFAARHADRIIACSKTTKNDILRMYRVSEEKIEVIYEAADPMFRVMSKRDALERARSECGIKDRFFLYVGVIHLRRNVERLLKAFKLFSAKSPDYQLVLIGKVEWPYLDVKKLIEELGLDGRVIHLGYVEDSMLPLIYNSAECFVYPSLYEGFGLPVLEAMACGTPVITSDNSSLSELFADAVFLIDPYSVEQMGQAMSLLVEDTGLRDELISKGLEKVKEFSWRKTAEKTLQVYKEVAEG
ncbi:glycosyltransferase family 1 protein [candidate division TA06 bacterium]|uniref:Glycosyltransferase family 1 protein n=1 Tax=candidate division TA06 bacterium TaxID=2250710 RepID=A0A523UN02_UNCT6|nr:MAG: glycosyltransferase family 1 protein [candidate division TA06 bacterium]